MWHFKRNFLRFVDSNELLPLYSFYYEGFYDVADPIHEGGIVGYIDENGNTQYELGLWAGECRLITAHSIVSVTRADVCVPI